MAPQTPAARLSRRALLSGSAAAAVAGFGVPACATRRVEPIRRWTGTPGSSGVFLRWFGNNAWEIHFGTTTILIDPWFTRFPVNGPDTLLTTEPARIDPYLRRINLILVCRGQYDHLADVPYIAAKTGARVVGTRTHCNLLRALDVPANQLGTVGGGEHLAFDKFAVDVFRSAVASPEPVPYPGMRETVPPRPRAVADLVEGGALIYQLTIRNRFRILVSSTAGFVESELAGLQPDLAIATVGAAGTAAYAGQLLRTLDHPTWVMPTGWDDVARPLTEPARDWGGLAAFRDAVGTASPGTSFIKLDHLELFTP